MSVREKFALLEALVGTRQAKAITDLVDARVSAGLEQALSLFNDEMQKNLKPFLDEVARKIEALSPEQREKLKH